MNFFEEVHLRTSAAKKSRWGYPLNFKIGILIGSVSIILILAIVSFQHNGNAHSFEETALRLDSIQIRQNDRMIELLETRLQRDTTILHVVAPAL